MVETNTSVLFLLHQKAQIPDSVFDLQEEICQCAWLCPGDKDILGQVAAVGLGGWLERVERVEGGWRLQFYFCSSPVVLSDFDKDLPGIIGCVS